MWIKNTMRYHYTLTRIAKRKTIVTASKAGYKETGSYILLVRE